jgi:hypothetical protein
VILSFYNALPLRIPCNLLANRSPVSQASANRNLIQTSNRFATEPQTKPDQTAIPRTATTPEHLGA